MPGELRTGNPDLPFPFGHRYRLSVCKTPLLHNLLHFATAEGWLQRSHAGLLSDKVVRRHSHCHPPNRLKRGWRINLDQHDLRELSPAAPRCAESPARGRAKARP